MARVNINGTTYVGNNITICNGGKVIVNGKEQTMRPLPQISVTIEHGSLENLHVENGDVTCGNVGGNVHAGGAVQAGQVDGNVDAGGSVKCSNVGGDVDAGGSVSCGMVNGSVDAGGSVRRD